ncbi:MAG: sulfotransferase [Phycisphaeraceae bacterium]|nr:MAG: sulfotransferase [Phycisphaeraceae bacterium]
MDPTEVPTQRNAEPPGPVFVSGRQHSGNSVITKILMQAEGCLGFIGDNGYWEHKNLINKVQYPAARADRAVRAMRFKENPELGEAVRGHLPGWIRAHPDADAREIYLEAMRYCTEISGNRFWLQKSTSYIFYADEILRAFPGSRIVYLMRNPYDLCASLKRRHARNQRRADFLWGTLVGWKKGVRIAHAMQSRYPDRFRIFKYEDVVSKPSQSLPELFEFVGYAYREEYTNVPRVNTSDNPADWSGSKLGNDAGGGLTGFRINYYDTALTKVEKRAADMLLPRDLVLETYPNLPHTRRSGHRKKTMWAILLLAVSGIRFSLSQFGRYKKVPYKSRYIIERTLHRARA